MDAEYSSPDRSTVGAVRSLLDAVGSESNTEEFDIGNRSKKHGYDNHGGGAE